MTLSAGAKFISTSNSACIKITGTGQLSAIGTSASPILISADIDKDGVNGEAGEYWGDIYITSVNSSALDYCTVERGTRTNAKLGSMGGGMYISSSAVTITNSIIRYCTATKGGGVYIASGHSPYIKNCLFLNNNATENGGAAYISSTASPTFTNVIFNGNSSSSTTLKGGTIASVGSSPKIVNSTIVNSSSPAPDGSAVYLENSAGAVIVNTILWGGTNLTGFSGTTSSVFASCAIQGETYSGCLNLNSSNTAIDGPNFTDPLTGNFSLGFDSPCRDAGISTYTGVTIPTTDYIGTQRVGKTDIGAYEMLYARWTGLVTADWGRPANWERSYVPGTTRNVIIPAGLTRYPTFTPSPSFTLSSGLKMIIEPGTRVTLNNLTNNGTIVLQANATARASLMINNFYGSSGNLIVQQPVTGGQISADVYRWHYIAPPATVDKSVITDITPYDLMMYDQSKVTTDISQGWQWHDGWAGTTGFSTLNAKMGYLVYFNTDTTIVYNNLKNLTTTIGQIDLPFNGSGGDTSLYGYHCIGNSLSCGINWDLVTRSDAVHVRNAIYIQAEDVVASYVNGVGTNGGSAHIPPFQGFMVKTRAVGTYITIPNTAKEHNSNLILKSASTIPLMRLEIQSSGKTSDETVIRLESSSSLTFDDNFDASKVFSSAKSVPQIYTSLSGELYSINSIPWPESQTVIPLIVKIPVSGTYKICRTDMQSFGATKAFLTDNLTNTTIDLSSISDYTFTSVSGTISDRFIITISDSYPSKSQVETDKSLKIYQSGKQVCIIPQGHDWNGQKCTVRIFDISGRLLLTANEEYFYEGEIKEFSPREPNGLIIVEVSTGIEKYSEKIILTP